MRFWRNISSSRGQKSPSRPRFLLLSAFCLLPSFCLLPFSAHAALVRYSSGNWDRDVNPPLYGPVLDLSGSSSVDDALQADVDRIRGCSNCDVKINVVVIRASGADGYNPVFMALKGVDSIVTLLITDRESAQRDDVVDTVKRAEFVWFAGGDQCNYIRWIKGTRTEDAVKSVYKRGGAIGGNSAGLAIQGDVAYDSCPDQSAQSATVLKDPFHVDVHLSRDFFHWRYLDGIITDTHFAQRDRMGRTLVFLARSLHDYSLPNLTALGVDEDTSVVVGPDGVGRVYGPGAAYLVLADHQPDVLEQGKPLTYRGYKIWKFPSGSTVDLAHRPTSGFRTVDVVDGVLSANPY